MKVRHSPVPVLILCGWLGISLDAFASALHDAVATNDAAALATAIATVSDINERNGDEATALFLAAEAGRIDLVKSLIDKGADIETGGSSGRSPLMIAAAEGNLDIMDLLLSKGADIECSTHKTGWTCLMSAAWYSRGDAARVLIKKGADIHKRNEDGSTALSIAAGQEGNVELVRQLIKLGADFQSADNYGFTPLFRAKQAEEAQTQELLEQRIARAEGRQNPRDVPANEMETAPKDVPVPASESEQQQSDTLYCIAVYGAVGNQDSIRDSLEGATARAARAAIIQRFARLVGSTPDNKPEVLDRVEYADTMLQEMRDDGESLVEMLGECNEAYELEIKGD